MKLRVAITLILLSATLFMSSGAFVVFKLQEFLIKKEIKQRIKAGVSESELVLIKIPVEWETKGNEAFQRIHSREFRYFGEMYDIVRYEKHDDTTYYHCIHDVKESALFANLDDLVRKDNHPNPERQKRINELLRLISIQYLPPSECEPIESYQMIKFFALYRFSEKTWHEKPPSPPPRFCIS